MKRDDREAFGGGQRDGQDRAAGPGRRLVPAVGKGAAGAEPGDRHREQDGDRRHPPGLGGPAAVGWRPASLRNRQVVVFPGELPFPFGQIRFAHRDGQVQPLEFHAVIMTPGRPDMGA